MSTPRCRRLLPPRKRGMLTRGWIRPCRCGSAWSPLLLSTWRMRTQLCHALGDLARQALTGSDFGLPVAPTGITAILPHNIQAIARDLKVPSQEILVYIAAREAARQRLFKHVPWLVERLVSSV